MRAVDQGLVRAEQSWISFFPSFGATPTPARGVAPETLRDVLAAIREPAALQVTYQSMSRPEPIARGLISRSRSRTLIPVKTVEARIAGLSIHVLGHLRDGNLHYSIASDTAISDALLARIKPAVMDGLKDIGGSFSAEHGIGTEKRDALETYGDAGKLTLNRMIKQLFDPSNICNAGKVL